MQKPGSVRRKQHQPRFFIPVNEQKPDPVGSGFYFLGSGRNSITSGISHSSRMHNSLMVLVDTFSPCFMA